MALLSFPTEVLPEIWNVVSQYPDSIASFAATCKRLHTLGAAVLSKHRAFIAEWSMLYFGGQTGPVGLPAHPISALLVLLDRPLEAQYVRALRL